MGRLSIMNKPILAKGGVHDRREYLRRHLARLSPDLEHRVDEVLDGRVKDFFTEPHIVQHIGTGSLEEETPDEVSAADKQKELSMDDLFKKLEEEGIQEPKDTSFYDPSYFCLVRMTDIPPLGGKIKPAGDCLTDPRYTLHFTLNGPVIKHGAGDWTDKKIAIILPAEHLKKRPLSLRPEDIVYFGEVELPKEAVILAHEDVDIPDDVGCHVEKVAFSDGDEFRKKIHEKIFDMGYLPIEINSRDWYSEPYNIKYGDRVVPHQLGYWNSNSRTTSQDMLRYHALGDVFDCHTHAPHDTFHPAKRLETSICEAFSDNYDFKTGEVKRPMTEEEFDSAFPDIETMSCLDDDEKRYLDSQIAWYRKRLKKRLTYNAGNE